MKKIIFALIALLLISGCNYNELNDIYLVSALAIDYTDEYTLSLLTISDNEDNPTRVITGKGKSIKETFYNISQNYNKPLYLGHLNLIIISEETGSKGIEELLKIINEDNETKKNFYIVLAELTKAIDILNSLSSTKFETKNSNLNNIINKYLSLENINNQITYNDYITKNNTSNSLFLTSYKLVDDNLENGKIGIIENNKFNSWSNNTDGLLILNNMINEYILKVDDDYITLKDIKTIKKIDKEDSNIIYFNIDVNNSYDKKVEQKLQKMLLDTVNESIRDKKIDYLQLKDFIYKHTKKEIKNLSDIKPIVKINFKKWKELYETFK